MYDNGTKQTWRGWAWNQIANRLAPGELVVVLCGEAGLDYECAESKGFNVVGVDLIEGCVSNFRRKGGIGVVCNVSDVISELKPSAVILDEVCGITKSSLDNLESSRRCKVVVGNYLRGRDSDAVPLRQTLSGFFVNEYKKNRFQKRLEFGIHRGALAWIANILPTLADCAFERHLRKVGYGPCEFIILEREFRKKIEIVRKLIRFSSDRDKSNLQFLIDDHAKSQLVSFYSYKSKDGGLFFDSFAASQIPSVDTGIVEKLRIAGDAKYVKGSEEAKTPYGQMWLKNQKKRLSVKRKVAAVKALLTRKLESN